MTEEMIRLAYAKEELRKDFNDCLLGWGDGDYSMPLIGAIITLFMEQARIDRSKIGLTDIWYDRARSASSNDINDHFLGVSLGRIIDIEIVSYDYYRHDGLCVCFAREIMFSGPERETKELFSHFRNFAKEQEWKTIMATARERLEKEKVTDGGTMLFFF